MAAPEVRPLLPAAVICAGAVLGLPWALGGRSPAGQTGLVLLLLLAGAALFVSDRTAVGFRASPRLLLVGGLVGASALHTIYPDRTLQLLPILLAYLLAAHVALGAARSSRRLETLLLGAASLSALLVTAGALRGLWHGNDGGLYAELLVGPFGYPNALGGFLLLGGGAAMAALLPAIRATSRVAAALVGAGTMAGLFLTRSRGAALAGLVGVLVWALVQREIWWPRHRRWAGALVLLGVAWCGAHAPRLFSLVTAFGPGGTSDTSVAWRLSMLRTTWRMIREQPWLGVGPGAYPVALIHYQSLPYVGGENPHNLYLEVAAEYGLPVACLLVVLLLGLLVRVGRALRRLPPPHPDRSRAAVLLGALTASFVHSAMDMDWNFPAIPLTAAVLVGITMRILPEPRTPPGPMSGGWRLLLLLGLGGLALLTLARYSATSLVARGRLDLEAANVPAALQSLTWASRLNPLSHAAHHWLAWARLQAGDLPGAVRAAAQTVRIAPLDPNTHALAGEIAMAERQWDAAADHFQRAAQRAPAAHLRFHAGLVEALSRAGRGAEALRAYERALAIFSPERVLLDESRCLAPGDRYLLARLSRIAARLFQGDTAAPASTAARDLATRLAEPDPRGICAPTPQPARGSPEAAVANFWQGWSQGGGHLDEALLSPGLRASTLGYSVSEAGRLAPIRRARMAWVSALSGNEQEAILTYELEIEISSNQIVRRCTETPARFLRGGWFLVDLPRIGSWPCTP
jgi:O-antigen ligase/tetratricopeptide (TPR) repeat protein